MGSRLRVKVKIYVVLEREKLGYSIKCLGSKRCKVEVEYFL